MSQATPEFIIEFCLEDVAHQLGIDLSFFNTSLPIEEISTGLPYLLLPVKDINSLNKINLEIRKTIDFLIAHGKYKTNSKTGLSTSFFFYPENCEKPYLRKTLFKLNIVF